VNGFIDYLYTLLTYLRSCALSKKLPIVQPFRKFPAILRNPKVHHRVHKSPPLVPILSQFDPVPTIPSYLSKILLILSTHLRFGLPSGLFPSGFPTNILYVFLVSPIRATCPTYTHWPLLIRCTKSNFLFPILCVMVGLLVRETGPLVLSCRDIDKESNYKLASVPWSCNVGCFGHAILTLAALAEVLARGACWHVGCCVCLTTWHVTSCTPMLSRTLRWIFTLTSCTSSVRICDIKIFFLPDFH
jgi:hypothetical protein